MQLIVFSLQAEISDVAAIMATNKDEFRKPETGMWKFFIENGNDNVEPGDNPTHQNSASPVCFSLSSSADKSLRHFLPAQALSPSFEH